MPLSYIRRDTSFARRRPVGGPTAAGSAPQAREQLVLVLDGKHIDLVRTTTGWLARRDAPDIQVVDNHDGSMTMQDGQGRAYRFSSEGPVGGGRLFDGNLYLLRSITAPVSNDMRIEYAITEPTLPDGSVSIAIDLVSVSYNSNPYIPDCYKTRLGFNYGSPAPSPLSLTMLERGVIARMSTLQTLDVMSTPFCGAAPVRLHSYQFAYTDDVDTHEPRLTSVRMRGQEGTPEGTAYLPVANYKYGSLNSGGWLTYQPLQATATGATEAHSDASILPPYGTGEGYATNSGSVDINGDGRPEVAPAFHSDRDGHKFKYGKNISGGNPIEIEQHNDQMPELPRLTGEFDQRVESEARFNYINLISTDEVWRQAVDINGDGRTDFIDAKESPGVWVVYMNGPGQWQRFTVSITPLGQELRSRGHQVDRDFVPLARRTTGHARITHLCLRWAGAAWIEEPLGYANGHCIGREFEKGPESTVTEWAIRDVNGDGYPDVVFNSEPVIGVTDVTPTPPNPGVGNQVVFAVQTTTEVPRLRSEAANSILSMLNVMGVGLSAAGENMFSASVVARLHDSCGVAQWVAIDDQNQKLKCDLQDVNGDGLTDRVVERSVFLNRGTIDSSGMFTQGALITLPGALATEFNNAVIACLHSGNDATTETQTAALRDLTGDGIPDYITRTAPDRWDARLGTGTGFGPVLWIPNHFNLSDGTSRCTGATSYAIGLGDLDGDGKPEVVAHGTNTISLVGSAEILGAPESGRLVEVGNGYGAKTLISYRSMKRDGTTAHEVPFPEIVVSSVRTVGSLGFGGSLAETLYAYGDARLLYDPAADAFTFRGYGRVVELRIPTGALEGVATITDRYLPSDTGDPYGIVNPSGGPFRTISVAERYATYLRTGMIKSVTVLSGLLGKDATALLKVNVANDARRIAGTYHQWAARLNASAATLPIADPCQEMVLPYRFIDSILYAAFHDTYNVCTSVGFGYESSVSSWRGAPGQAPPSSASVSTLVETRDVDELGRVLLAAQLNDELRNDDDICIQTTYAQPTTGTHAVRTAVSSRRTFDCGTTTLAKETWEYDKLPFNSVSQGLPTAHTVERRDDTGHLLGAVREFDATYDFAGNPEIMTMVRQDGLTRTAMLEYDEFFLAPISVTTFAVGVPSMRIDALRDPITMQVRTTIDTNFTEYGTVYDGFGRPVLATVAGPGGASGVLSSTSYLGFADGDSSGRRIVSKEFTDVVAPASVASAVGRTRETLLDELGRARRTELSLGSDYSNQKLVTQARIYDTLGRVAFEAEPFPTTSDLASAYGTSYSYNTDGTPLCVTKGPGLQLLATETDEVYEVYPTCYQIAFQDHVEVVSERDASSLLKNAPQERVVKSSFVSASGRLLSRLTRKDDRALEYATFTHDRLGRQTSMVRFQDPGTNRMPVTSSWRYDSLGWLLSLQEPFMVPTTYDYDNWGNVTAATRVTYSAVSDGAATNVTDPVDYPSPPDSDPHPVTVINRYDALGRLVHREQVGYAPGNEEATYDYFYDKPVNLAPEVVAANTSGRLAKAVAPTGSVLFSYDRFGNISARTFTGQHGERYVEKHAFHDDGSPSALDFYLPDTSYRPEHVSYIYDSAGRGASVSYSSDLGTRTLFQSNAIDVLGRVTNAQYGQTGYGASYFEHGRRLLKGMAVSSLSGSRTIAYDTLFGNAFDPVGRERLRTEVVQNGTDGSVLERLVYTYDELGRLSASGHAGADPDETFTYDALGNVLSLTKHPRGPNAATTVLTYNQDQLCNIRHVAGLPPTDCSVEHDPFGNIVTQPTSTGTRHFEYLADGHVRSISDDRGNTARFQYDAFGGIQQLDVASVASLDSRHDLHYGSLIGVRDELVRGSRRPVVQRKIPGPYGFVATLHGPGTDCATSAPDSTTTSCWEFAFGEGRGTRFVTDENGTFVQDIKYSAFGEATSSGAQLGQSLYQNAQWNGGDALEAFGLSQLGDRLYDPTIGRFLSRDPLLIPRTATTTNPYAFAMNDPVNLSDPSGRDCYPNYGKECMGPTNPGDGGGPDTGGDVHDPGTPHPLYPYKPGHNGSYHEPPPAPPPNAAYVRALNIINEALRQNAQAADRGFFAGLRHELWNYGAGFVNMAIHPIDTLSGIGHMVLHPIATVEGIVVAAYDTISACVSDGGAACAKVVVAVGSVVLGTQVAKIGKLAQGAEAAQGLEAVAGAGEAAAAAEGSGALASGLSDATLVCRGGTCTAARFASGSGVTVDSAGALNGVSVNSAQGATLEELAAGIPNRQIGVTTVGQVRELGGNVVRSPTRGNPFHSTLSVVTAEQAERLFTPTIQNPTLRRF